MAKTIMERLNESNGAETPTTVVVNVDTSVNVDTEELLANAESNITSSVEEVKKSDSGAEKVKEVKYKTITSVLETETNPEKALKAIRKIITKFRKEYINGEDIDTLEPYVAAGTMDLLGVIAREVEDIKDSIRSKNTKQKQLGFKLYNNKLEVMVAVATSVSILRCLTTEDLGI